MNLIQPLSLPDAVTDRVEMTPTKAFFKPVLVISVPIDQEVGRQLQCEYLWNEQGTPHRFEGSHQVSKCELPGADVMLEGKHESLRFKTEKVTKFRFSLDGDGEQMVLTFRVHLPEDKEEERTLDLLRFLKRINKAGYTVHVTSAQPLLKGSPEAPGEQPIGTLLPVDPVATEKYKNPKCSISLGTVPVEGGWIAWWELRWQGKHKAAKGEAPLVTNPVHLAESLARESAARSAFSALTSEDLTTGLEKKEQKPHADALGFLMRVSPTLMAQGGGSNETAVQQ